MNMHHTSTSLSLPTTTTNSDQKKTVAVDKEFLRIAQGSFDGTLIGYLASYSYDESVPEDGYVGGAEKWDRHTKESKQYAFKKNGQDILRTRSEEIANEIVKYTDREHSVHFFSIAPGTQFEEQDIHLVRAFNNASRSRRISLCTILDINPDFAHEPMAILKKEFPNLYAAGAVHDIYKYPIAQSIAGQPFGRQRKSVALYTGGTVGNIAMKRTDTGFPERQFINHLKLQFDYTADESYLVLAHNMDTSQRVRQKYSGEAHAEFALNSLYRIAYRLPTTDFDPSAFAYDNVYEESTGRLGHNAVATKKQRFKIGNKEYNFEKGEVAVGIGNSFQISNERMGDMTTKAGVSRLRSFTSEDGCTAFQILQANRSLMDELRKRYNYTPR